MRKKGSTKPTIVLVEPSSTESLELKAFLGKLGYKSAIAQNGEEALEQIAIFKPKIIITEIIMPQMDGYQLLIHLKGTPTHRHLPVIIASRQEEFSSIEKCMKLGADNYLLKPINEVLLQACVTSCLEKQISR